MTKVRVFDGALVAMIALGAVAASTASALTFELALWLINGNDVVNPVLVIATGNITLENVLNGVRVECSAQGEGFIENGSLGLITMVWDLELKELIGELSGSGLRCVSLAVCEPNTVRIWPSKIEPNGWLTEVEEDPEDGTFWGLIFGVSEHFECKVFGLSVTEECTLPEGTAGELLNVTGGVEGMGSNEPASTCNGNSEEGLSTVVPGDLISSTEGTVSVSLNEAKE